MIESFVNEKSISDRRDVAYISGVFCSDGDEAGTDALGGFDK